VRSASADSIDLVGFDRLERGSLSSSGIPDIPNRLEFSVRVSITEHTRQERLLGMPDPLTNFLWIIFSLAV
jgi:hypothetical protein